MSADLSTRVAGLELKNPVIAASCEATATPDQILQSLESNLLTQQEPYFAAGVVQQGAFVRTAYNGANYSGASHKALADYYGLKSLSYEGGNDLGQSTANIAAKIAESSITNGA